jgi:Tol biopolymer transport system component
MGSGPSTQVTTDGGSGASWSPDGTKIAFTRDGDLWIIDVSAIAVAPTTWGAIKAHYR